MVFLVKALRTGLGLASEAIHAARDRPSSKDQPHSASLDDSTRETSECSNSPKQVDPEAHVLAVPYDEARNGYVPLGKADTSNVEFDCASDHLTGADQDEAAWQLDDMIERLSQPISDLNLHPGDGSAESMYEGEEVEEGVKIKQREALARELVAMADSPPVAPQGLPCPVIIPQRRPRNKDRGFVRAYAPVLQDCGISQDVFLQFLEYLDTVNHVCNEKIYSEVLRY